MQVIYTRVTSYLLKKQENIADRNAKLFKSRMQDNIAKVCLLLCILNKLTTLAQC